jgi:hypothetical protein
MIFFKRADYPRGTGPVCFLAARVFLPHPESSSPDLPLTFPPSLIVSLAPLYSHLACLQYYYYLCAILKVDLWWKKYMTQFQIIQFCLDITCCAVSAYLNNTYAAARGTTCSSWETMWPNALSCAIVLSYLLLFIQFYWQTYKNRPSAKNAAASKPTESKKDQ